MNSQNTPQPDPKPATPDVRQSAHWLVCADIMDRAAVGQATYGVPLVVDNGRDHMMDGYQEMLDAVCYRRMEIEQRRQNAVPLSDDALAAECAARGWGVIRPTQGAEAPVLPSGGEETALPSGSVEAMAIQLSHAGWIVASPDEPFPEGLWQRIGEKEGYALTSAPSPVPMAPILAPEEEAPLTISLECAEGHPLLGHSNGQMVFEHCLACELDRPPEQAWSAQRIRERLGELGIPTHGLWGDHWAEVERREIRWKAVADTTQEVPPWQRLIRAGRRS